MNPQTTPNRSPSPAAILLVPLLVAIAATLFVWPSARLEPRDLPVGVAGPAQAVETFEQGLAANDGAFDVKRYADEAAARQAIEDRDVYGAFVATPDGAKVLTASAASSSVAQMLTSASADLSQGKTAPKVEDVKPLPEEGRALSLSIFPLILAGSLTGMGAALLASGALRRTLLVAAGSIAVGVTLTAIVHSWLGVVDGDWAENAAVVTLTVVAIASFVAGMFALFGRVGAMAGSLTMILIGNPWSGIGSAPEMLPQPVGDIGQLMPPGAGGNLLRSTGYFDGAAAGGHITVLVVWVLVGLAAVFAGGLLARRPVPAPVPSPA